MDLSPLNNTFFGFIPRQLGHKDSGQCLCDWCSTRLRKHDGYLNVYSYQFTGPLDDLSNEQKDAAIKNHGMVPGRDSGYGNAFHGKLLPPKRPFGQFEHPVKDKCFKAGYPNGCRTINAYRQSTQVCERGGCCADDCREYGDALERYLDCRERCSKQDIGTVTQMCGPPPINPALNGCKRNWTPSYSHTSGGWGPDLAYRKV